MAISSPPKKKGRPPKEIDRELLTVLAGMQCTYEEMSAALKISKRQFIEHLDKEPELRVLIEDGKANGRMSIRRQQFKLLAEGDRVMAIWLGKQYLGQRDRVDNQLSGPGGGPIQTENVDEQLRARIAGILERRGTGASTAGN